MAEGVVGYLDSWKAVEGRFHIGSVDISRIANSFGTPLYIYDADAIRRNYHALAKALGRFTIAYSVKANPLSEFVSSFNLWDAGQRSRPAEKC